MQMSSGKEGLRFLSEALEASKKNSFELAEIALYFAVQSLYRGLGEHFKPGYKETFDEVLELYHTFRDTPRSDSAGMRRFKEEYSCTQASLEKLESFHSSLSKIIGSENKALPEEPSAFSPQKTKLALLLVLYFPTEVHRLFAGSALRSVQSQECEIEKIGVVNYASLTNEDHKWIEENFDHILVNNENALAKAWNKGIAAAFCRGAQYVAVVNYDLAFHPQCFDHLVRFAQEHPEHYIWSATAVSSPEALLEVQDVSGEFDAVNMSCFLMDQKLFRDIGEFDERILRR